MELIKGFLTTLILEIDKKFYMIDIKYCREK